MAHQKNAIIEEWTSVYGQSSSTGRALSINIATDGAIHIAGTTYDDGFIKKLNSTGQEEWTQMVGANYFGVALSVNTDSDGSVYVTGFVDEGIDGQEREGVDAFIKKFNSNGSKEWTQLLGTSEYTWTNGISISTASDGSIYVTGFTEGNLDGQTNSGDEDIFISKYKSDGSKEWTRVLGTSSQDSGMSVSTASDGSIYVTGFTEGNLDGQTNIGDADIFISKYKSDGSKEWTRLLGTSSQDSGMSVGTASDGSIYISGITRGDLDGQTNGGEVDAFVSQWRWVQGVDPPNWDNYQ